MKEQLEICAIVAIGPDNVIGRNGVMPWHSASDLAHFRKMTLSHPCIFGRNTFEHLPIKPLDNRFNVVVGSQYKNKYCDNVFYASSVERAIFECSGAGRIFICGGAQIYDYSLTHDLIDTMYLTIIKNPVLEYDIQKNPDTYCRFTKSAEIFLKSEKWMVSPIIYPPNTLPKDDANTITEFYRCTHVR